MKPNFMKSRIEADFEFFVKALPSLEPVEFCGLAKILNVKMTRAEININKEEFENWKEHDALGAKLEEVILPMDEVLEAMMDKYLSLNKKRRKEINQILKEIKKSRKSEVNANGPTT